MKILKFNSERCAPCKQLKDILEKDKPEGIEFIDLDNMNHIEEFKKYGVRTVPTLIEVDEDGNEIQRWLMSSFLHFLNTIK